MDLPPLNKPTLIVASHLTSEFDCGIEDLNVYLNRYALGNNQNRSSRTYVATRGEKVVGYYSLAANSVTKDETPERVKKGLANYPIPVILLARLAVDNLEKGKGLGRDLLRDALLRCLQAADIIGCRAVLVHATNDDAVTFYRKYGFESAPGTARHLYLLMKDILATVSSAQS